MNLGLSLFWGFLLALGGNSFRQTHSSSQDHWIRELVLISDEGDTLAFDNQRDQMILINFWASWCKPCIKEMPLFEQLEAELDSSKSQVILIALDSDFSRAMDMKRKIGLKMSIYRIYLPLKAAFVPRHLPFTILIDEGGNQLYRIDGEIKERDYEALRSHLQMD